MVLMLQMDVTETEGRSSGCLQSNQKRSWKDLRYWKSPLLVLATKLPLHRPTFFLRFQSGLQKLYFAGISNNEGFALRRHCSCCSGALAGRFSGLLLTGSVPVLRVGCRAEQTGEQGGNAIPSLNEQEVPFDSGSDF